MIEEGEHGEWDFLGVQTHRRGGDVLKNRHQFQYYLMPCIISNISRYRFLVPWMISSGSGGAGGLLSQSVLSKKSRTYCLSKLGGDWPIS